MGMRSGKMGDLKSNFQLEVGKDDQESKENRLKREAELNMI